LFAVILPIEFQGPIALAISITAKPRKVMDRTVAEEEGPAMSARPGQL